MLTFSCLASLCKKREIKLILGRGCIKRGFNINSMQQSIIGQKNVKNIQSTSSPAVISLISIIFHFELNHYS